MPSIRTQLLTNLPRVTSPNGKLVGVAGEDLYQRLHPPMTYGAWQKHLIQTLEEGKDFFWVHERWGSRGKRIFYLVKNTVRRIPEDLLMRRTDKQGAKGRKKNMEESPREISPAEFLENLLPEFVLPEYLSLSVAVGQDGSGYAVNGKVSHAYLGLKSGYDGWKRNQIRKHAFVEGKDFLAGKQVTPKERAKKALYRRAI